MQNTPDSCATKHSLTMIQRQYIDSRFSENVAAHLTAITDSLADNATDMSSLRAKLSILSHRISILESLLQKDDNSHPDPVSCNQSPPKPVG